MIQGDLSVKNDQAIYLNLPAAYKYFNVLGGGIAAWLENIEGLSDADMTIYAMQLAVQEICTNVVDHALDGQSLHRIEVTLALEKTSGQLIVEVSHNGQPFDPTLVPEPDLESLQERGRGLFLVRQLVDEVIYHTRDQRTWRSVSNGPWQRIPEEPGAWHPDRNCWRLIKNL